MLQAAMPRRGVAFTLAELARKGLVKETAGKGWSLTRQGIEEAQRAMDSAALDPAEVTARAGKVHKGFEE
jgi:hypothetical protein